MGPRIFGIIALHAPVVAVVRRGPIDWMHVSRWDLETLAYEPRGISDHVQWAEWDARGRLLVATDDGRMQIRDGADGSVQWEADEGAFEPDPTPPPAEASTW